MHEATYLTVADDTRIEAQVVDAATTEIVVSTRFGQRVVVCVPSPRDGQRFAIALSDAIRSAEKRGIEDAATDDRKLDDDTEPDDDWRPMFVHDLSEVDAF